MKIIIKESKVDMLMTEYLDSWVSSRRLAKFDRFIVLENPNGEDENDSDMEYDGDDGRLWFRKEFRYFLSDLFGKSQVETMTFVGKYFENKFGVEVNKVESYLFVMKRIIKLTESDLIHLIKKVVNEQENRGSDAFEDYVYELEQIYQNTFNLNTDGVDEDDMEFAEHEIAQLLNHAETNVDISDEEVEELYEIADDVLRDMDFEFSNRNDGYDINEGTTAKKPRAMRSRKSGIKTAKLIKNNQEILKKIK